MEDRIQLNDITKRNKGTATEKKQSCHPLLIKFINYTVQILDIPSEVSIKNHHLFNLSGE